MLALVGPLLPSLVSIVRWNHDVDGEGGAFVTLAQVSTGLASEASPVSTTRSEQAIERAPVVRHGAPTGHTFWVANEVPSGRVLSLVWLAGVLLSLARVGKAWCVGWLEVKRARQPVAERVIQVVEQVRLALEIRAPVQVRCARGCVVPFVFGIWHHTLVLPDDVAHWAPAALKAVVMHECAHIVRRDPLRCLLGAVTGAIHWFNPLVRMGLRRAGLEGEQACDDVVLRGGSLPLVYARQLLDIATLDRQRRSWQLAALGTRRRSSLERRLDRILDPYARRGGEGHV